MEGERTLVHAYVLILCVMQPALREESDSRVNEMLRLCVNASYSCRRRQRGQKPVQVAAMGLSATAIMTLASATALPVRVTKLAFTMHLIQRPARSLLGLSSEKRGILARHRAEMQSVTDMTC